jgi:PadR family transcriptional regulator, regulatory protein PadR
MDGDETDKSIVLWRDEESISYLDMKNDVLRHLFTGFVRLHILYHAAKEPICGVEIMEELRHHGYKIGPGTLYPVLHGLEGAGLVTSEEEIVDGKRRKNFRITKRGRKLLDEARVKLQELASEVVEDLDARKQRSAPKVENE